MTEVVPVFGRTCTEGHLHFDLNLGLVEYLDLDTGEPAEPGALATVVVTPFFPYRDCMPVFRYDTRDVVNSNRTVVGINSIHFQNSPRTSASH